MSNITALERRWCEENSITIDDYKNNYSRKAKDEIKSQMRLQEEAEKIVAKQKKEEEKKQKEIEKIEAKQAKEDAKIEKRNAMIASYPQWAQGLIFAENGKPESSITNFCYYFDNNPLYKGHLTYDNYTSRYTFNQDIFNDKLYRKIILEVDKTIKVSKPNTVIDSLKTVADSYSRNSATDMLDQLKWDGVKRLETLFIDHLKVKDTELNRIITRTWVVGAVKRLYEPGCPNENVLILTGGQGVGKSLTLKWLAGDFGFDAAINISSKEQEYGMKLQNCWFCCFDELSGLSKKAAAEYKNWFSITCDSYRPPYGHEVETKDRHNAYCATTNDATFLKDYSDNNERRMWVLECHGTKEDGYKNAELRTDKLWRQIMAEAVYYYKKNPDFIPYLGAEWVDQLAEKQKKFKDYNSDDLGNMLCEILDRPYILQENGDFSSVDDLLRQIKQGYRYRCAEPGEKIGYINHISHAAVKRIVRDILGTSQKHEYFKAALDGRWCVKMKQTTINKKVGKYYVRGTWKNDKEEIINKIVKEYDPTAMAIDYMSSSTADLDVLGLN